MGVAYFGMTSLLNPVTGAPLVDIAKAMADCRTRWTTGRRWRQPAGQQGRLVRPQQHQLRIAGHAARLPGDLVVSLMTQGAVGGDAGLRRRDPQAARQDGARGKDDLIASSRSRARSGVLRDPASFVGIVLAACAGCRHSAPPPELDRGHHRIRSSAYWYYHLPNFVLAALMYTLLGRVLLSLFVEPDSSNYIWRFFCRITDPVVAIVALVTPKAAAPVVRVAVRLRVAVLAARRFCSTASLCAGAGPAHRLSAPWTATLLHRHRLLRHDQRHLQPLMVLFA